MALGSHEHSSLTSPDGAESRIRKKKSLKKLLGPAFGKSSKSQSQPASPRTPATLASTESFPYGNLYNSRTSSADVRRSNDKIDAHKVRHASATLPIVKASDNIRKLPAHQSRDGTNTARAIGLARVQSSPCTQTEALNHATLQTSYVHKSQTSPTFQISHKRSNDGIHTTPILTNLRFRSSWASLQKTKDNHSKTCAQARPRTAVGDISRHHSNIAKDSIRSGSGKYTASPPLDMRLCNDEEVRASFRSALTNNSSAVDASSTSHSSVITRRTSLSDSTVEIYETPILSDHGMTVDDAINLYAAGFADDVESIATSDRSISTDDEERRSERIAEAINSSIDSCGPANARQSILASPRIAPMMFGAGSWGLPKAPSSLPTSTRDEYGFLKASQQITIGQYDAWNATYSLAKERRVAKWLSIMPKPDLTKDTPMRFPERSAKTQRFIRKGFPPSCRGAAWFHYAGGQEYLERQPNVYEDLVACSGSSMLSEDDKEIIERDLHRTFPDNIFFKPDHVPSCVELTEPPLLSSLRRVLQAFALHSPKIGYCQSLNFIAGLLLLFLPEEKAFWMLHIITTEYLPGTHDISLEGANVDLWVLMTALKQSSPEIWTKVASGDGATGALGTNLPSISLCTTSWFMSLFIGTLPIESVLRIWDILFYEGSRTLFRVALAIFKVGRPRILDVSDSMEMFQAIQSLPRGLLDINMLLNTAFRRGGVSQIWVEKKRLERKRWYANERVRATRMEGKNTEREVHARPRRVSSMWRRKRKENLA